MAAQCTHGRAEPRPSVHRLSWSDTVTAIFNVTKSLLVTTKSNYLCSRPVTLLHLSAVGAAILKALKKT
jgi:hypothetical protein